MQKIPVINFHEAKDFSSSMGITFSFLRQNAKRLSKSLLFFAAPPILLAAIFYYEFISRTFQMSTAASGLTPAGAADYFSSINFFVTLFAMLICLLTGGVLMISTVYAYILVYQEKGTPLVPLNEVWKKIRQLFWRNFGTMFLYYMGMSLALGVLMIPLMIMVWIFSFISPFLAGISVVLFYAAIIVLCIHFALTFYIRCKEGTGFFSALNRLNHLAKGKFWSSVWLGGTSLYVQMVLAIIFALPWYLYLFLVQMHDLSGGTMQQASTMHTLIGTALFMIYSLCSILLSSIPLVALAVQYHHLVEHKEAPYLMARIAAIGANTAVPTEHEDF